MHASQIILAPVMSEKSYAGSTHGSYTFKVERVNLIKVQAKPKRRGAFRGTRQGWKKAVVQLRAGDTIEIFQGAQI